MGPRPPSRFRHQLAASDLDNIRVLGGQLDCQALCESFGDVGTTAVLAFDVSKSFGTSSQFFGTIILNTQNGRSILVPTGNLSAIDTSSATAWDLSNSTLGQYDIRSLFA